MEQTEARKQSFELDLRMTETGILSNVEALKTMLPNLLKPYDYVVSVNNIKDAKADRTKLNTTRDIIKNKRMQFEKNEMESWLNAKKSIMELEKMIDEASNKLGDGIKKIEEEEKISKMEEVRQLFETILDALPVKVAFEALYIRKEYDKNSMTVKKILEDMQVKVNKLITDWKMLEAYLPTDPADIEQVKVVFANTLDIGLAKAKADELNKIRQSVSEQRVIAEPKKAMPQPQIVEQTIMGKPTIQKINFAITAEREFFDLLNRIVAENKHLIKNLVVISKEEIEDGVTK
ncbi:DUF1351 domain-containing protein [Amedibacillus dolichus]|uniref:DUF1351 domain-containing protein n=1 Tax=Amedibacillus dolichus DSM 3991 TaxID=428127 RepID=A8RCU9_9FIRM|nr:DUF1351 domain-containing protein [Amedibacillus dolichus]EDP10909.1 hypothetical protein EUBDOL_01508 [Amedibacillus dolichus DSM 3991]